MQDKVSTNKVEAANKRERVFTSPVGGEQILWRRFCGVLVPAKEVSVGWRALPNEARESVWYYDGYGWMTTDELFDERQRFPQTAP